MVSSIHIGKHSTTSIDKHSSPRRADKYPSNAGGGGERVLWTAIALLQRTRPDVVSIVYSGDTDATKEDIIAKVQVLV